MRKHKISILLLLSLAASLALFSQPNNYGVPMITNYDHSITKGSEQNWCITQDFRGIIYVGNTDKGVLEYDGVEWRNIPIPNNSIVRSMITGEDGIVYVGAESEFGLLEPNGLGDMQYRSLSDTIDQEKNPFSGVWKTYDDQGKIYFCTFANIFIYDKDMDKLEVLATTEYAFFAFFIDNSLYLSDYGEGLLIKKETGFVPVPGGDFFREMSISGLAKFDETRLLVSTYVNGVFLINPETGEVDAEFADPFLNEYFQNGVITYLHPLNKDFVVATQFSGLVILNREGKAREIITKENGLIDETIPYVYSNDKLKGSGPVWIANWMGVSKLETNNPFRLFTETSGFEGFISDIETYDNKLFISTFSGLYYKNSTSTSTRFIPVPEIQDELRQLHLFKPSPNVELLLAFSEATTYVIDKNMNVSIIGENVINLPPDPMDQEEYSGEHFVQDPKRPDVIYTGRRQIVGLQYRRGKWKEILRVKDLPDTKLLRMEIDKFGYLWTSTPRRVIRLDISLTHPTMKYLSVVNGLPSDEKNQVFLDPETDEIMLGSLVGFLPVQLLQGHGIPGYAI